MPTAEYFANFPTFPTDVPVLDLPSISLQKLQVSDREETQRMFNASTDVGFFKIDLKSSSDGRALLQLAKQIFDLSEVTHKIDPKFLQEYASKPPRSIYGYKAVGVTKLEDGQPDNMQHYNISRDDVLGTTAPNPHPLIVENARGTLRSFFYQANSVIEIILDRLDLCLGLPRGTLVSMNRLDRPSGSSVRLLRANPQAIGTHRRSLLGHTDFGSLTMLFNTIGGLQVLPVGSEEIESEWRYVKPEPGCAIINFGDAMVEWSGGILRSNLHRVVTPPGEQATCFRHSVAYVIRPEAEASMKRLTNSPMIPQLADGEHDSDLCARDWEAMRVAGVMAGKNLARSRGGQPMVAVAT